MITISKKTFEFQLKKNIQSSYIRFCILEYFEKLAKEGNPINTCIKGSLQYALVDVIGSDKDYQDEESHVDQVNNVADYFGMNINW
jgi:hypothetical protein